MTPADRTRHLKAILDRHDEALRAFHASNAAFDHAMDGLRATITAVQNANHAQREAIDAISAANRAALALFNADQG